MRLKAGTEIFLTSFGPDYKWLPYQCALVRRALESARCILANSVSATARQIRKMASEKFLFDLVRNRPSLDTQTGELTPLEGHTSRQWFTRAFTHPACGAYCALRRAGALGESTPNWSSLFRAPVTSENYNLRSFAMCLTRHHCGTHSCQTPPWSSIQLKTHNSRCSSLV